MWQVAGDRNNTRMARGENSCHPSPVTRHAPAFTLVELLVVISVIAVLAAFTFSALSAVKKRQYISNTQAELGQLQAAIDGYHAAYGFYPPGNPKGLLGNQLYYELIGMTNTSAPNVSPAVFQTLDRSLTIDSDQLNTAFGLAGFVNCSKFNAGADSQPARNFIHELKPRQTGPATNNGVGITILVGSVGGPDVTYMPLHAPNLNPWRYVSPGTNNPTSYDLWIQLHIGGKEYLVCNWSKEVQINNPLP